MSDTWDITRAYKQFRVEDQISSSSYVSNELTGHRGMPKMSPELQKTLSKNVSEIFSNTVLHSCTQLDFTVADLGVGMRQNIKNCVGIDFFTC